MKYENYIFDLYGTLVDIHTDEESDVLWEKMSQFFRQHSVRYTPEELRTEYETGVKNALEMTDEFQVEPIFRNLFTAQKSFPSDKLVDQTCRFFRTTSTEYFRLYPWTLPILKDLKKQGKKIYLLSNAQRAFTAPELQKLGLCPYFDDIFISSDFLVKKPNPEFFQLLMERHHLTPETCLMVGNDEICDISGAKKVGMDTFYIHSNISPEYTGKVIPTYKEMKPMEIGAALRLP